MDNNVRTIMRCDQSDILLLPDAVGAAQDIIDDVGIFITKTRNILPPLALRGKNGGDIASADIGDSLGHAR